MSLAPMPHKWNGELEEKEDFWNDLDEMVESVHKGEGVLVETDLNGHVGERNRGDEEVMGRHGFKERNLEGQMVVDFLKGCKRLCLIHISGRKRNNE